MNSSFSSALPNVISENISDQKTWIANDIISNYWLVAKSGYDINVCINTSKEQLVKINFKKEICPHGFLTDSLYSNLLIDLKKCLINIFENGSTQKPYRLRGISNNIIYLIISVNEHRQKYDMPPILAFNQITEENILDFIKSFKIEPELIHLVLGELRALGSKPKEQDWVNIKNKHSIRNKTYSILKSRITTSKDLQIYKSENSIRKNFPDANTCRKTQDYQAPNKKTVQNYIADINHLFQNSNHLMYPLRFSPYVLFNNEGGLDGIFKEYQNIIKTSIIPLETAFHLISNALKFQHDYGEGIILYLKAIDEHYKKHTAHLKKSTLMKDCERRKKLFYEVETPKSLTSLNIKTLGLEGDAEPIDGISLTQAVHLYTASMYILLASFSATRELSLLLLKRDCFHHSPLDGLFDIRFKQQKANTHNMLQTIYRPIPQVIYRLGIQYCEFSQYLENRFGIFNSDDESYLFTNFHGIKKIITRHFAGSSHAHTPSHIHDDSMQSILNSFTDWTETPLIDGKRWYVSDHQFRRLFAVLYFNLTDDTGIEELAWFLGHESLEMTFHYAEVAPSDEWIDEAIKSISKRAASINENLNIDEEIGKIVELSREKSLKLNLQLEDVIYEAINERVKSSGEKVHFTRIDENDIYFYFSME